MRRIAAALLLYCLVVMCQPARATDCTMSVIAYGWTYNENGFDSVSLDYEGLVQPIFHRVGYEITWKWWLEAWDGQQVVPVGSGSSTVGGMYWTGGMFGGTIVGPRWDTYGFQGTHDLWNRTGYYQHGWGYYHIRWWHSGSCTNPNVPATEQMTPVTHTYGSGFFH